MTAITYYGHSCFRLEADNGWSAVFDPYEDYSVPGLKLPRTITADEVFISHPHEDHNAAHLIQVNRRKLHSPYEESTLIVPHDDADGTKRGMNQIRILENSSEKIVHFGDLGRMLNIEEISRLHHADVIMIPCGGYYTIDSRIARAIIERVEPKLAILMHYRTVTSGYSMLENIAQLKETMPELIQTDQDEITLGSCSGIILMKARQK